MNVLGVFIARSMRANAFILSIVLFTAVPFVFLLKAYAPSLSRLLPFWKELFAIVIPCIILPPRFRYLGRFEYILCGVFVVVSIIGYIQLLTGLIDISYLLLGIMPYGVILLCTLCVSTSRSSNLSMVVVGCAALWSTSASVY